VLRAVWISKRWPGKRPRSDASLAEINPLVALPDGTLQAIDAKVNIDDAALFRHPELAELRDPSADEPAETEAREKGLSYVKLDGSIGCIVNGAGLAMATMDLIKYYGAEPANFLDIGGSSNPEKVVDAMRIIFGGITRCDDVANGIVQALSRMDVDVPIVIRLTGTNENKGLEILESVDLPATNSMDEVVRKAIELATPAKAPAGGSAR
jgi:succinyl-CoA synthetase beta subunit